MLRQQHPAAQGEPYLCLADFIRPLGSGITDRLGIFCTTVDGGLEKKYRSDDYLNMMAQTLCDRLAEATAEKLHEEVRRSIWGYAPDEQLSIEDQHLERYPGIRPAIGGLLYTSDAAEDPPRVGRGGRCLNKQKK